jgi:hypothetical protein
MRLFAIAPKQVDVRVSREHPSNLQVDGDFVSTQAWMYRLQIAATRFVEIISGDRVTACHGLREHFLGVDQSKIFVGSHMDFTPSRWER